MALNYDATKVDFDKYPLTDKGALSPITEALVWMTLYVDMGDPSRDKHEWVRRVQIYEKVFGAHLVRKEGDEWVPGPLSYDEIMDHAGLKTNAPNSTKYAFNKKVMEWLNQQTTKPPKKKEA